MTNIKKKDNKVKSNIIKLTTIIVSLVIAIVLFNSCTDMVVEEFPLKSVIESDFINYVSNLAEEDIDYYTLTILNRDYKEEQGQIDYLCSVQYKWKQLGEVFTDKCAITYVIKNDKWSFEDCDSEIIIDRVDRKLVYYDLFLDSVYASKSILPSTSENLIDLSSELEDFTIKLAGVVYKLPCCFSELASNGWIIAENSQYTVLDTIEANSFGTLDMTNNGETITVYLTNLSDNPIYIGESQIGGFKVRSDSGYIQVGTRIDSNSTEDQVINAFNTPTVNDKTDTECNIEYNYDDFVSSSFLFNDEYTEIEILNFFDEEKPITPAPFFETYAFNFAIGDTYYSLPCQLSQFIDAGWKITKGGNANTSLFWYESKEITISKEYPEFDLVESIDLLVENTSLSELNIISCSVTKIKLHEDTLTFDIINYKVNETNSITSDFEDSLVLEFFGEPSRIEYVDSVQSLFYNLDRQQYLKLTLGESTNIELCVSTGDSFSLFDRFNFDIVLGDEKYDLPCSTEVFADNGWSPKFGWDQPIMAKGWSQILLENKNGDVITAYISNLSEAEATLETCMVGGIHKQGDELSLDLSGGIGTHSSLDTVIETFGLPYSEKVEGNTHVLMYKNSINEFICMNFKNDYIDDIWIVNFMFPVIQQEEES